VKTFFLFLLFPFTVSAQDLTGVWQGFIITGENKLPYEITISRNNNELSGYSMIVFTINGIKNVGLKSLKLTEKKGKIHIEDGELLYDNYTTAGKRVILKAILGVAKKKNAQILSGPFGTRTIDIRQRGVPGYSGTIELTKKEDDGPTDILGVLHELDLLSTLSFLSPGKKQPEIVTDPSKPKVQSLELEKGFVTLPAVSVKNLPVIMIMPRRNEIIREINFTSDSIMLTLFDNGEVDGDTVTVLLNGKVLMNKKALTAQPIKQTVYFTPDMGDSILLVMYAESLGIYPPNTGLLIIEDGKQRWQVNFKGDFEKSSAIILRRKR